MAKNIIRKNSARYNELCDLFCTKFINTFGETSGMNYQELEKLFRKRVKR